MGILKKGGCALNTREAEDQRPEAIPARGSGGKGGSKGYPYTKKKTPGFLLRSM
jgi:hypothetical protein